MSVFNMGTKIIKIKQHNVSTVQIDQNIYIGNVA